MLDALDVAAVTVDNALFAKALEKAKRDALGGISMSVALESTYMPGMATSLISIGERTGALS